MGDQTSEERRHPDSFRITSLIRELLDEFPDPHTGRALPGLLTQAWNASNLLLTSKPQDSTESGYSKPGSRPPCRLDTWAHVQSCLDDAHVIAADDLGCFVNSQDKHIALERLPALLEPTYDVDCAECERCRYATTALCRCRHRLVTRRIAVHHATLMTDLFYQDPASELPYVSCPGCGRKGKIVVRKDQERIYCRFDDCEWHREGVFAIIAVAS